LNARAAEVGKPRGEVEVEAAAGIFGGCGESSGDDLVFGARLARAAGAKIGLCLHAVRHSKAQK